MKTRIQLPAALLQGLLVVVLPLFPGLSGACRAQETGKEGAPAEEATDRENRILELFTSTSKKFEKGNLVLVYDFESKNEDLVLDWKPDLETTKMRVRWARGIEGTVTTIEHGILVGDYGEWIHKAMWLPGLEVKVEVQSVAQFRPGTVLAPVFYNPKKKRSIGANGGFQAVNLSGYKTARPPVPPKVEKTIPVNVRHSIGYKYDGKVLECFFNGKKTCDSSAVAKFSEGIDTGHVGLAWNGSVQSFVYNVTMTGRLDPDWVAKQLGEKQPEKKAPATPKKAKAK